MQDALTWTTRQRGTLDQVRTVLSPAGREFLDAAGGRIDREVRGDDAERHEAKLQLARGLADKELREGPIDPAYVRQQTAAWEAQAQAKAREAEAAREAERAPAPLLPAWRDPTGQGRDSLGRVLDEPSIAAVVVRDGAVQREREALRHYLQGAYRDPEAAQAALGELVKQRGWYQAREEIAGDPTQFGELRGKVGWFVSAASKEERARAERVVQAVPDSLRRVHETEDVARQGYVQSVQAQQVRDGTEVPGLSKAALAVLEGVREARLMAELPVKGEDHDVPAAAEGGSSRRCVARRPCRSARGQRAGRVHGCRQAAAWRGRRAGGTACRQQRQEHGGARRRARAPSRAGRAGPQLCAGARRGGAQRGLGSAG